MYCFFKILRISQKYQVERGIHVAACVAARAYPVPVHRITGAYIDQTITGAQHHATPAVNRSKCMLHGGWPAVRFATRDARPPATASGNLSPWENGGIFPQAHRSASPRACLGHVSFPIPDVSCKALFHTSGCKILPIIRISMKNIL